MAKSPTHIWKFPDVIDLDYFLHEDEKERETGATPSDRSDREIYLSEIEPLVANIPDGPSKRKMIFRHWVDIKRGSMKIRKNSFSPDGLTPGMGFHHAQTLMIFFLIIIGFISGAGLAASLLFYTGNQPINVSVYIGVIVIFQIFLLSLLCLIWVFRPYVRFPLFHQVLYPLFLRIMLKTKKIERIAFSGEREGQLRAITGLVNGKRRIYGSLFLWPFFVLTQAFGLAFNAGVFLTTWVRVLGTDLAFGWQSTLQVSSQAVFALVKILSIPWTFIVPEPVAHPTLDQIEGSRLILKEGMTGLSTGDLVSWWPFLLLCVFFYGILPRLILLVAGISAGKRALATLQFNTFPCDKLLLRLTTPVIGERKPELIEKIHAFSSDTVSAIESSKVPPEGEAPIVIVPSELFLSLNQNDLDQHVMRLTGRKSSAIISSEFDFPADRSALSDPEIRLFSHVFVLQEGWQPPIRETLSYYKDIRQFLGPGKPMILFLVGKPESGNIFTAVEKTHYEIWNHMVQGLGDPYTHIERIIN